MKLNYIDILEVTKQGNWEQAHKQVQPDPNPMACLIHGYLHRLEGDLGNARYWYSRAGATLPENTLEEEWERLYTLAQSG